MPTGNSLLINARIELSPADLNEAESIEMQRKLELLNEILEQEVDFYIKKKHMSNII